MEKGCANEAPPVSVRKRGVLIADDEPAILDALELGLQSEGFSVWLAADGQEALDVYRSHCETIDVVLLDVRMPVLDGPATLVALQQITPTVTCCFMSGYLGHYTEEGLRRFGARAVLKKPFKMREVAQVLRDAVEVAELSPFRTAAGHETLNTSRSPDRVRERDWP
jgi:CheY-like chemotaxis protein